MRLAGRGAPLAPAGPEPAAARAGPGRDRLARPADRGIRRRAPFAALTAGTLTHSISVREQQAQAAAARQVPATLLQKAPIWSAYSGALGTEAQWRAPDGQMRPGFVAAPRGAAKGSTVLVWVDRTGQLTNPPLRASQVTALVDLAEMLTMAVLATMLTAAWRLARRGLDRRRMAAWDADWLATGPRWTPRR